MFVTPVKITTKIRNALRIDRAFHLVWAASKVWTILSIILTLIQGVLPLLTLYVMKLIVDSITYAVQTGDTSRGFREVAYLIIAAATIAIFQAAMSQLAAYISDGQALVVTDYVSATLHKKSIRLDLAYYENPRYHDTLHRAQQEGPFRPTRIVNGLTRLLQNGVSLAAMVGLLFMFHWAVGILLLISTLPGMVAQVIHARKRFEWQKKRTHDERVSSYINTLLTFEPYAKEIRLFELGSYFSSLFNNIRNMIRGEKLSLSRGRAISEFIAQFIAAVILMGCFLLIAFRAFTGAITVGDMVMFFQAFQRGIGYLKDLLKNVAGLYEDNMFVAHFFEFLDIKNNIVDPTQPMILPAGCKNELRLENVKFGYPGERKAVLNDISITIGEGQIVALVGANGAGKSTLVKLLCRLYDPQSGTISMSGVPLQNLRISDLRKQISVVFQDYVKYFLTIKHNIWVGDSAAELNEECVKEAAIKADAHGFIEKLPRRYDTQLGRWFLGGEELSIGEWQKIALARAFMRDSQFIILDEPTSSLDVNTEYHLFQKFKELIAGKSALLISHRFSTVRMADEIYVLHEGKITERGSHDELMQLDGLYSDMYRKQASWVSG